MEGAKEVRKTSFGSKLRLLMSRDGLTVRYTAKALGVSPTTVQRWRSGDDQPSDMFVVAKVARLFRVDFSWLAVGEVDPFWGVIK